MKYPLRPRSNRTGDEPALLRKPNAAAYFKEIYRITDSHTVSVILSRQLPERENNNFMVTLTPTDPSKDPIGPRRASTLRHDFEEEFMRIVINYVQYDSDSHAHTSHFKFHLKLFSFSCCIVAYPTGVHLTQVAPLLNVRARR